MHFAYKYYYFNVFPMYFHIITIIPMCFSYKYYYSKVFSIYFCTNYVPYVYYEVILVPAQKVKFQYIFITFRSKLNSHFLDINIFDRMLYKLSVQIRSLSPITNSMIITFKAIGLVKILGVLYCILYYIGLLFNEILVHKTKFGNIVLYFIITNIESYNGYKV